MLACTGGLQPERQECQSGQCGWHRHWQLQRPLQGCCHGWQPLCFRQTPGVGHRAVHPTQRIHPGKLLAVVSMKVYDRGSKHRSSFMLSILNLNSKLIRLKAGPFEQKPYNVVVVASWRCRSIRCAGPGSPPACIILKIKAVSSKDTIVYCHWHIRFHWLNSYFKSMQGS